MRAGRAPTMPGRHRSSSPRNSAWSRLAWPSRVAPVQLRHHALAPCRCRIYVIAISVRLVSFAIAICMPTTTPPADIEVAEAADIAHAVKLPPAPRTRVQQQPGSAAPFEVERGWLGTAWGSRLSSPQKLALGREGWAALCTPGLLRFSRLPKRLTRVEVPERRRPADQPGRIPAKAGIHGPDACFMPS